MRITVFGAAVRPSPARLAGSLARWLAECPLRGAPQGQVGRAVLGSLVKDGHEVTAFERGPDAWQSWEAEDGSLSLSLSLSLCVCV